MRKITQIAMLAGALLAALPVDHAAHADDDGGSSDGGGDSGGGNSGSGNSGSNSGSGSSGSGNSGSGGSNSGSSGSGKSGSNKVQSEQEHAREAVDAKRALPLKTLVSHVNQTFSGKILDVKLGKSDGHLVYRVTLISPDSRLRRLRLDALTLKPVHN